MSRKFDIHELRSGFLLVIFVDARPITTLTGTVKDELVDIGHEWVRAVSIGKKRNAWQVWRKRLIRQGVQWDGVERRRMPRTVGCLTP